MLVCDAHHRVFDRDMVAEHPVDVLMAMKGRHEARIKTVTAIGEDLGSHVIRYAAKIGTNKSPVAVGDLKWAMLPDRYPIDGGLIAPAGNGYAGATTARGYRSQISKSK